MTKKAPKPKKCKACLTFFTPRNSLQVVCSVLCAVGLNQRRKEKEAKKQNREAKAKLKTKSDHLKDAQAVFNKFIRLRDEGLFCISCQKPPKKKNAGHFKTDKAIRFHEDNCHLQCEHCNSYLSGNIANYRIHLIKKIGLERVEWLEGKHETPKYTIPDILAIKSIYQAKCKELE